MAQDMLIPTREAIYNALDFIRYLVHYVAARHGVFVHPGRIHPHFAGIGSGSGCGSVNYGPTAVVTYIDSMKLNAVRSMSSGTN